MKGTNSKEVSMSYQLTNKERELIEQKVKETEADGGIVEGFKTYKDVEEHVTRLYIQQRDALKYNTGVKHESSMDKLARYEAAARGDHGNQEREDRKTRLNQKINNALSGPKVGFGDIKRITADITAEFEQEERFKKMKF